uniref:NADH dehydrogenase subunit 6 n=1 Tax=Ophioleila elegans TaxID=1815333 RepID=UPI0023F3C459|nr:NADH dehydrogenase subunit 6 [Ophioleila elegans]WED07072.1 NADH dehydrogenase subunit 6 [Ophioleila elegans]
MLSIILLLINGGSLFLLFTSSPFFGVFGVLLHALCHAALFCLLGMSFFGLVVVLIYVGGMLIVFLFSTVLSAERYPNFSWGAMLIFWAGLYFCCVPILFGFSSLNNFSSLVSLVSGEELMGAYLCYSWVTCLIAVILLGALVAVLSINYEQGNKNLRGL